MLNYANLTKAQARFIDRAIEIRPHLAEGGTITLKECAKVYDELRGLRSQTGEKIGYPNWLYNKNKISRGVYVFPAPGVEISRQVQAKVSELEEARLKKIIENSQPVDGIDEDEFMSELRENGIAV